MMDENTAFVSANQASRFGSDVFVHNGIDLDDYPVPDLSKKRTHTHFLAKAAWRLKNVKGAINVATKAKENLIVMGGTRLNLKMGFRFTPNLNVRFKGMVGNEVKSAVMNASKGLIFPVLWHEPFGIAIIESLYFGCPVFGTPYGSLPELIPAKYGVLSNSESVLAEAVRNAGSFDNRLCHEYAADNFNMGKITSDYLVLYEKVLNGQKLSLTKPKVDPSPQQKFLPWYK
jgi:glycosyltransferase involved in cell wall biosynthesis